MTWSKSTCEVELAEHKESSKRDTVRCLVLVGTHCDACYDIEVYLFLAEHACYDT